MLSLRAVSSSFVCNVPDSRFTFLPNPNSSPPPVVRCVYSQNPQFNSWCPLKPVPGARPFSCSAVAANRHGTTAVAPATKLQRIVEEFQSLTDPVDRVKKLLHYAEFLPPFDDSLKTADNRVPGCTAQVWLRVELDRDNRLRFSADSDSEITKGFCSCLIRVLDGATPEQVLAVKTEDLGALSVIRVNGEKSVYSSSRGNTWYNVLMSMQKMTKALVAEREGRPRGEPFPSLIVTANGMQAKGSYAEAQVKFYLYI